MSLGAWDDTRTAPSPTADGGGAADVGVPNDRRTEARESVPDEARGGGRGGGREKACFRPAHAERAPAGPES